MIARTSIVLMCISAVSVSAIAANIVACSDSKPPLTDPDCLGEACGPISSADAGGVVIPACGEGDASALGDADRWGDGPRGGPTSGKVGTMKPPAFSPLIADLDTLAGPVILRVAQEGVEYTGKYDPTTGYALTDVPVGNNATLLVEDIEGVNGILPSMIGVGITPNVHWPIPVTKRADLEAIYAKHGLTIQPDKAQVIVTVTTNGSPVKNAFVGADCRYEAVLYDTTGGEFAKGTKTGDLGMAIIVNMGTVGYPGEQQDLPFTRNGSLITLSYRTTRGAVTRAYIY